VPDENSVTFKHFKAGWEAKPHKVYQEVKMTLPEDDGDLL
jgi:hypothetical protein